MFFGRLSRNPAWMQAMLGLSDGQRAEIEKVSGQYAQLKQLIFARWDMVMYHFEKQLYANPDQDLNRSGGTWSRSISCSSGRPDRDSRTGPPRSTSPPPRATTTTTCSGEMLASQLHHTIVTDVLKQAGRDAVSYVGQRPRWRVPAGRRSSRPGARIRGTR